MNERKIKFTGDKIDAVKKIVAAATVCNADVDVVSGRYVVDAKSIMGWFSLDLEKDLLLKVHGNESDATELFSMLADFLV